MSLDALRQSPDDFARALLELGVRRAHFVHEGTTGRVTASHPNLDPVADFLARDRRDFHQHEAVFLEVGAKTKALFGAFVHDTRRGQGQGGLRHWPYDDIEEFLRDGLRLARGMTRKNALAGLWWGGAKGIIARPAHDNWKNPSYRTELYREYATFVTGIRGCYITAEDVGTNADDMAIVYGHTRFSTCIPGEVGGSGNPSPSTARGVVCAMEAALEFLGMNDLRGKTIAMQGTGNVGACMIDELLQRKVARIVASEIDPQRRDQLLARHQGAPLEVRLVERGDDSIVGEPCDILAPNALGGCLGPHSIDRIQAKIVCGAANNQLLEETRDAQHLAARNILYVPDFVANRMGIVNCANEQYGSLSHDPAVLRHFDRDWENSVFAVTLRILASARAQGTTTSDAANRLADDLAARPHPLWGHRARAIVDGLVADGWAQQ